MLTSLIYFLIALLVLAVVFWGVDWFLANVVKLPAHLQQMARVILGVVALIVLLLVILHFFGGVL